MTIITKNLTGNYLYDAVYLGTPAPQGSDGLFAGLEGTPLPPGPGPSQVVVNVAEGAPFICGYAVSNDGSFPTGVTVTVVDPDGNALQPEMSNDRQVIFNGESVYVFMIANPAAGTWTLNATFPGSENAAHVFMSTIPTHDVAATMIGALGPHGQGGTTEGFSRINWACIGCKTAVYVIAIAIIALIALGIALLTPEAAPVIALAGFLSTSVLEIGPAAVVAALKAIGAGAGLTVGILANYVCQWITACPSSLTVKIKQPANKAKVSGTITLQAVPSQTCKVTLTVDANAVGVVKSSPWDVSFNTKTLKNGTYTLAAIAVDNANKLSALATPIQFVVSN